MCGSAEAAKAGHVEADVCFPSTDENSWSQETLPPADDPASRLRHRDSIVVSDRQNLSFRVQQSRMRCPFGD